MRKKTAVPREVLAAALKPVAPGMYAQLDVDQILYALEQAFGVSRKQIAQAILDYAFEGCDEDEPNNQESKPRRDQ